MKKNAWIYHHFAHLHQKLQSHDIWFLRYGAQWTDGRTEKVTEVAVPPKKKKLITNYQLIKELLRNNEFCQIYHSFNMNNA